MRAFVLVAMGGAAGAVARHAAGLLAARYFGGSFPVGTLVVNVAGSFLLGVLLGLSERHALGGSARLALGTGLCGALTTFSTFGVETIRLVERGHWEMAAASVGGNLILGFGAAGAGLMWGRA